MELNEPAPKFMSERARDELPLLCCALPMHWIDLKLKVAGKCTLQTQAQRVEEPV